MHIQPDVQTGAHSNLNLLENRIKSEPMTGDENEQGSIMNAYDIKTEPVDGDENKGLLTESLYTSEGLQASYKDLEQIFDEENSELSPLGVGFTHVLYFSSIFM